MPFHYLFGFSFDFSINSPILRNIQPPPWKNTTHFRFVPSTIFCLGLYRRTGTWAILKSLIWSEGSSGTFWRRLKALWIWRILFITPPMPSNDARYAFKKDLRILFFSYNSRAQKIRYNSLDIPFILITSMVDVKDEWWNLFSKQI